MAGKKTKDYRKKVEDVAVWKEKLEFTGLTVAEIYSDVFGPCDVMKPTIDNFCLTEEDAEKVVQFLQVNLTDLEKDVKQRMAEEKKKEAERAMLAQRQAAMAGTKKPEAPAKDDKKEEGEEGEEGDSKDAEVETKEEESWEDKFRIPIVEDHSKITPRPLFLFIKDKVVVDTLTTANPPLMLLMIKNAMSGRKTTGQQTSGLQEKIAAKRAKRAEEEKRKAEDEALAKMRNVPIDVLEKQDSTTSSAIIAAFKGHQGFKQLAELTTKEIKNRDEEDGKKLKEGIQLAIDKNVLPNDKEDADTIMVDVMGKTAEEVADEIVEKLGDAPKSGCVMTLEGLSGTGKGTTVAKLKEKLPNAMTWSNGDIFRSITLLAAKFAEEKKVELDEALKPENLQSFMAMLTFDKFEDGFDVEIKGLGYNERVSKVNKTLLKSKQVATNIPKVARVTQGEVIVFVKDALAKMAQDGKNVLVEGRAATLKYIDTPHRYELIMSDENIIGQRRAAQRIGATALAACKELKDGDTWPVLEKTLKGMLPAEVEDSQPAETKKEKAKEEANTNREEEEGAGETKESAGDKPEEAAKSSAAAAGGGDAEKPAAADDADGEKPADKTKEEEAKKEEAKKAES
mmetsp:Transcript_12934/g.25314  ORF Transcript_12934/g.25314 Transcript_12934/m.25314 type:complete len:624 (-) Transcript_12934:165-2036(-)